MSLRCCTLNDEVFAEQDFAKLVKASGSEYTKIATAGNFGDLRRNVLLTGEALYMASENSAAVNSDLKLPAVGSLGAKAGQASYLPSQPFRTAGVSGQGYTRSLGRKVYELTDHLGNVHATVSDRRIYDATLKASLPEVQSLADYYPFGMQMPGKKLNPDRYRYGFNGKEHETGFGSDSYDFGARVYNSLTGQWITPDPRFKEYPSLSVFSYSGNNPIKFVDVDGERFFIAGDVSKAKADIFSAIPESYRAAFDLLESGEVIYNEHKAIEISKNPKVGPMGPTALLIGALIQSEKNYLYQVADENYDESGKKISIGDQGIYVASRTLNAPRNLDEYKNWSEKCDRGPVKGNDEKEYDGVLTFSGSASWMDTETGADIPRSDIWYHEAEELFGRTDLKLPYEVPFYSKNGWTYTNNLYRRQLKSITETFDDKTLSTYKLVVGEKPNSFVVDKKSGWEGAHRRSNRLGESAKMHTGDNVKKK